MIGINTKNIIDNTTVTRNTRQGFIPLLINNTYNITYLLGTNDDSIYVRYHEIKLIIFEDNHKELYNITADPHENNNIAREYPETVKELSTVATAYKIETQKIITSLGERIRKGE